MSGLTDGLLASCLARWMDRFTNPVMKKNDFRMVSELETPSKLVGTKTRIQYEIWGPTGDLSGQARRDKKYKEEFEC